MSKDLNNLFEVSDLTKVSKDEINLQLEAGKTAIIPLEKGEHVIQSLKNGFSNYLNAKIELKEEKENCGICGCGKPANVLVYAWRN